MWNQCASITKVESSARHRLRLSLGLRALSPTPWRLKWWSPSHPRQGCVCSMTLTRITPPGDFETSYSKVWSCSIWNRVEGNAAIILHGDTIICSDMFVYTNHKGFPISEQQQCISLHSQQHSFQKHWHIVCEQQPHHMFERQQCVAFHNNIVMCLQSNSNTLILDPWPWMMYQDPASWAPGPGSRTQDAAPPGQNKHYV